MPQIERHPDKLKDKTVLLIAGTGGIGLGAAIAVLDRGAKVILTSTRQAKLDEKIAQLHEAYSELPTSHITGYTLDLGSAAVEKNIQTVVEALKSDGITTIHHLCYFAGDPLSMTAIEDVTIDSWLKQTQIRTISAVLCIKHFIPFLRAAGPASSTCSPSITLTGGSVGDKPVPGGWTLVAMVAASLQGAARQLALDLKPVRVNTVAPGVVDTDLWSGMTEEQREGLYSNTKTSMPTGRVGDVADVAEAYIYSMCDGNLTGEVLRTNSGALLV